ncbi:hypothetical protein DHW03_03250 [Pedobacter yonginense]|uniref:Uncharacterized protein n=1 Tax=Pedobacter yonginense TaxID=651869 RepID=A0A317EQC2_9SPHI|nr:hypothetical protein [Pedobacter yonginense]PWS28864.1 hypothetical protein DHW03_03250 [Pedobacter yonginense]
MVKAGALYFSILIAFFIAVISASLIMLAAHYRNAYLKSVRFERLLINLDSGLQVALAEKNDSVAEKKIDLYGLGTDSISVQKTTWGLYSVAILKSFILQDTLKRAFIVGKACQMDSLAIYLSDEDRPVSVSGETQIIGNVKVPKSGIRKAYVDGNPYRREEAVYGRIGESDRSLTKPNESTISQLNRNLDLDPKKMAQLSQKDQENSFFLPTRRYVLPREQVIDFKIHGNTIIYSDTLVHISARADLRDVMVFAPAISVEAGFKGSCQLFARDSIAVGKGAVFQYPSVLGVLGKKKLAGRPKIILGEQTELNGLLFAYDETKSALPLMIELGKNTRIKGEVYCPGMVKLEKGVHIDGKVSCDRFVMQTPSTLYENFLIDVFINRKARNRYYLSSGVFQSKEPNGILKWLN